MGGGGTEGRSCIKGAGMPMLLKLSFNYEVAIIQNTERNNSSEFNSINKKIEHFPLLLTLESTLINLRLFIITCSKNKVKFFLSKLNYQTKKLTIEMYVFCFKHPRSYQNARILITKNTTSTPAPRKPPPPLLDHI